MAPGPEAFPEVCTPVLVVHDDRDLLRCSVNVSAPISALSIYAHVVLRIPFTTFGRSHSRMDAVHVQAFPCHSGRESRLVLDLLSVSVGEVDAQSP